MGHAGYVDTSWEGNAGRVGGTVVVSPAQNAGGLEVYEAGRPAAVADIAAGRAAVVLGPHVAGGQVERVAPALGHSSASPDGAAGPCPGGPAGSGGHALSTAGPDPAGQACRLGPSFTAPACAAGPADASAVGAGTHLARKACCWCPSSAAPDWVAGVSLSPGSIPDAASGLSCTTRSAAAAPERRAAAIRVQQQRAADLMRFAQQENATVVPLWLYSRDGAGAHAGCALDRTKTPRARPFPGRRLCCSCEQCRSGGTCHASAQHMSCRLGCCLS